ncbi:lysylphosphatidylglycerol synthase domain-containing protein [Dactylosporangium sucinum]|uniref:Membrane protein n=1 Tax=Dactylosporangium sucinum TaxID=1424081 RepID=A0A917T038_9ACTN|nr:lysylphosphatidylglycerol synthase domain-containing protein [Dactylosporangium sucinum]GGM04557.1 membrane protein [Dactylosporangium sucinum]
MRRRVFAVLRILAYGLVLLFLGSQLWWARHGLVDSVRTVGLGNALLAAVLAGVGGLPGMFGWRILLAGLGTRLPTREALRVYFVGGLARYLPGGIWPAVAHASMATSLGEPPVRLAAAFLASQGLAVVAGLLVGLLALPALVAASPLWWLLLPVLAAAVVPVLAPGTLRAPLTLGARLLRRNTTLELPGRAALGKATALMTLGWLISGTHVAVLAVALGADPLTTLTVGVGGFALSVVAGVVALVLPSGLGVRELVLGLTLATLLTGPALVTVVALSRILITVVDAASTLVVLAALGVFRPARVPAPLTLERIPS